MEKNKNTMVANCAPNPESAESIKHNGSEVSVTESNDIRNHRRSSDSKRRGYNTRRKNQRVIRSNERQVQRKKLTLAQLKRDFNSIYDCKTYQIEREIFNKMLDKKTKVIDKVTAQLFELGRRLVVNRDFSNFGRLQASFTRIKSLDNVSISAWVEYCIVYQNILSVFDGK